MNLEQFIQKVSEAVLAQSKLFIKINQKIISKESEGIKYEITAGANGICYSEIFFRGYNEKGSPISDFSYNLKNIFSENFKIIEKGKGFFIEY